MFKLESYVTPLILSYVDKYIKNLKPEDSQLSLWGGDAVFCNLDLRLDVLEQELQLPFTFVNGHIHELRIHVPWTKLGSEPVVITINTIECILKLHSIKDVSIASKTSKVNRKFVRRQEVSEAPPGYVQSLINRVISNISVVCNNLILKYVEDDIVLSLNIKSAELSSVNDQWEKAFVDINLQDVIVRKIISMQDLTVCLDKRDGSGKIETYQDPLLYRCSTVWRLYSSYNSPRSKYPSVTRIHMFCDKLDFSLTDQQLPMFMRLAKLCLALYYKDIDLYSEKCSSNEECAENILENEEEDSNDLESNIEDESWGSWMWSYVPQVLPVWNEGGEDEEESERETDRQKLEKIFQLGIFIEKASCVLKKTEISQDSSCYGASKFIFSPLAVLHQYGCCMEITVHGKDFVNVQLGITGATITGLGECLCGFKDFSDSSSKMDKAFLKAGVPPGSGHAYSYLSSSLFDPLAPENCGQKRKYCFDREDHLARLTEEVMVERFPAFAFDYVYDLEIPEEWIDKASSVTSTFLEDSNWRENAVCRVVLGPFCANITSSMVHRILNLLHCAEDHDYPPYSKPKSKKQSLDLLDISAEDIEHFEEFIPMRYYHLTLFKPVLRLFVADHAKYDMQMKSEMKKIKKINKKNEKHMNAMKSNLQPLLLLEASVDCVDLQANMPMYPQRVARIVGSVPSASDNLIYHCYVHHSFKLFGLEANLFNNQQSYQPGATIIPQSSVSFFWKYIILPEFWTNHSDFCFEEQHFECSRLNIQLTEPQLLAVFCICQSWIMKDFSIAALINSPLSNDILQKDKSKISCEILGIEGLRLKTQSVTAYKGTIVSVSIRLESADCMTMIFSAPEDTNDIPKGGAFQEDSSGSEQSKSTVVLELEHEVWFQFIFQVPEDVHSTIPLILSAKMSGSTLCLEPALLTWLSYDVPTLISDQSTIYSCSASTSHKGTEDESTCSSQTPAASCSFSMSRSPSVGYCDTIHFYNDVEQLVVDYYSVLKCLVLQVQIKSCCILFPNLPWTIKCFQNRYVICSWKDAIKESDLTEACVFCFPEVTIQSNAINCNLGTHMGLFITDLPISNIMITNKSQEYFPWTLSVNNFSMYTINNRRHPCSVFFVISPSAASTTIALSSKTNYLQLGLCIHVDTQALNFSCSVSQVQLIMNCLSTIFVCTKFIHFMSMWSDYFQQKPAFTGDKNSNADIPANDNHNTPSGQQPVEENLEKGKVISEERISDINSSSTSSLKLNRKVTLWIQFTLSKLTLNLFGNFASGINSYDFHFQFEAEEVITSLDIQEVYSKMKIKLSSLNINSFLKSDGDLSWSPGPYEGIVLCSNNNLSHCLKSAVIHGSTSRHPKIKVDNQPFLLITYTKALCTNAKKKWTAVSKQNEQIFTDDEKYISEIDMKVKPFDLILWMPVIKVIKETYYPLLSLAILKSQMSKKLKTSGSEPKLASFSNRNLPLLYIKSSSVRVFLPKSYLEIQTNKKPGSFVDHIVDSPSRLKPDVLLLQYDCINLTSQVENPLSRIILHSDFFAAAQSARTIGLPGSDVEDRQYQLDVSGLCLGSTVGEEIVKKNRANKEVPRHHPLIMGENPALEWNTGVVNESRKHGDPEPLTLLPIMSPLDIKLAVAPAIICNHPGYQGGLKSIVVAGISLEANVTSDICIYMSIQQIHLLVSVLENNFHLLFPSNLALPDDSINLGFSRSKLSEGLRDSGIESETSTRHLSSNLFPDCNKYQSELTTKASCDNKEFVPFEILITARSITVMLFAHEDDLIQDIMEKVCVVFKKKNCKSRNEKLDFRDSRYCLPNSSVLENHWNKSLSTSIQTHKRKRKRKKMHADKFLPSSSVLSFNSSNGCEVLGNKDTISLTGSPCEKDEDGYEGSSDSSEYGISKTFDMKKKTKKIYPFLCVSVSQPHSFITCHSSSQKFETSCFDLQFRLGSPSCHVTDLEACSMPVLSDFPESFLETKPGNPDLKTGIPPALYTITCCNFLKEPANVKLRVERPVKFNVGISMWNYSMMFVQSLERKLVGTALNSCDKIPSLISEEKLKQTESSISRFFTIISQFGTMEISTMQVVVEVDALPKAKVALLVFGLDNFMLNLDVDSTVYQVQKLQSCLTVSGAVVKTITSGNTWPIIYPLTSTITCKWQLKPWVQVTACVQCKTIFLIVGPQQLLSLKPIIDSFTEFLQKELGNQSTEKFLSKAEKKGKKVLSGQKHWYDDLRKGAFQFLQDSDGQKEPGVHEIVFSKADDKQPASMTWCYPEPRALTKIDVSPVPFHHSLSKSRKIICHLQYWDSMQHQFLDLCEFELSETVSCTVDLPHLDLNAIAISDVWRVLLDYGYDCDKDDPFENAEGAFLSPLALAACMCVDSYFDINLIPCLKLMVSFERLKINFYNTLAITGCPPKLYPFTFDGVSPVNQEFMLLILDDFTLSCNKWPSKLKIEGVFKIMTEVLEYRSLTMIPVLDPVDINADITVLNGVEKYPIVESEIVVHPCFIKLNQSIVHTLSYSLHSWIEVLTVASPYKHCSEDMLPNYYIICNNIQEKVRFGQINTDESIILASQKMHAYSWRSHKTDQMLRICLECLKWKWSKAFGIDHTGTQMVAVDSTLTLIIKIKALSNLQKQVVIDGHLVVSSRLQFPIQLKLSASQQDYTNLNIIRSLPAKSCSSSFVFTLRKYERLCISLLEASNTSSWSEDIELCNSKENQLIKIPWGNKGQYQNVWCRVVEKPLPGNITLTTVLLYPMYVIRNHLPRSLIANVKSCDKDVYLLEIEGRGEEQELFVESSDSNVIQLSFQMSSGMKVSNPPLAISIDNIRHLLNQQNMESEDFEELCYEWRSTHPVTWPYSSFEQLPGSLKFRDTLYSCTSAFPIFPLTKTSEAPNTELKVELSQRWSGLNAILLDVKPWALFLNKLGIDLFLIECGGREWKLAQNSTFVPPPLEEHFKLGIHLDDELFTSIPIKISKTGDCTGQTANINVIPLDGTLHIFIKIKIHRPLLCIFLLKSERCEGIQILTALPLLSITNCTDQDLTLSLYSVLSSLMEVDFPKKGQETIVNKKSDIFVHPLLFWDAVVPFEFQDVGNSALEFFFYLSFSVSGSKSCESSYPICLSPETTVNVRHTLAIPIYSDGDFVTSLPCVVTSHRWNDLIFLTISDDPCPIFLIHNQTNFSLLYGQNCLDSEFYTICEEKEKHLFLPCIPPGGSIHYSFLTIQDKFPFPFETFPTLRLAHKSDEKLSSRMWSTPIDTSLGNQFICIPEACDVRIFKERVGHTIYLFIEPVNRIELSAKEIRCRIALATEVGLKEFSNSNTVAETSGADSLSGALPKSKCMDNSTTVKKFHGGINQLKVNYSDRDFPFALCLNIRLIHASVVICDELKSALKVFEVIRLNIDNALLFTRSKVESRSASRINFRHLMQEVSLCFENLQIDNQMDQENSIVFDFPVILKRDSCALQVNKMEASRERAFLPNKIKENSFFIIEAVFEAPFITDCKLVMRTANVMVQPMSLYLEDALFYKLLQLYKSFVPLQFHQHRPLWRDLYLPKDVAVVSASLTNPFHLEHLKIDIREVYLSIHASLKLYLSLQRSLLRFQPFEKQELFTNFYELGRLLVFHYLTGALFRAGWVVGSLDLLGNPAGFARAIGTGVSDFVLLPYRGLFNGPRAFITGLSHGATALFTQISSGALLCVTNLAASVSRNMDLLSLDAEHLARQELLRRQLPQGLTHGLLQGLNGLGISLLGAIAGIVDHPLQVIVAPSTTIRTATGIVGGLGKGLVGIFTKPIGGAAEFVSQTGHGLLHGAGWLSIHSRQHQPHFVNISERFNSTLKLNCKLVQSAALGEILLVIEAAHHNEFGLFEGDILILTSQVLCVVSLEEDNQQRTFALTEIKCKGSATDQNILIIIPELATSSEIIQETLQVKDRVVEYVQRNWLYNSGELPSSPGTLLNVGNKSSSSAYLTFFIHPKYQSLFIAIFNSSKHKILGKGFPI